MFYCRYKLHKHLLTGFTCTNTFSTFSLHYTPSSSTLNNCEGILFPHGFFPFTYAFVFTFWHGIALVLSLPTSIIACTTHLPPSYDCGTNLQTSQGSIRPSTSNKPAKNSQALSQAKSRQDSTSKSENYGEKMEKIGQKVSKITKIWAISRVWGVKFYKKFTKICKGL